MSWQGPSPTKDPRQRRLDELLGTLAGTELWQDLALRDIEHFDDLRASVPLMDADAHAHDVEARLGFGAEVDVEMLTAAVRERERITSVWRAQLAAMAPAGTEQRPVALVGCALEDWRVDAIRIDDLATLELTPELQRLSSEGEPGAILDQVTELEPQGLVLPSLATCGWLESVARMPLERRVPSLRWVMAEHDLDARVRSRLPVLNAGWIHAAGRLGLPSARMPRALALATTSTLLELLAHGDPVEDPREREHRKTILPEHAVMGEGYELVVSSPLGFLRLRSGLHVQVVGFEGASWAGRPRPRVQRVPAPPPDVKLEGMTVPGAWLTAALRQAFQREDPALVAAQIGPDLATKDQRSGQTSRMRLDPFEETELGAGRDRRASRHPRAVLARVEVQGQSPPDLDKGLAHRMDEALCGRSAPYRYLRSQSELLEPRVLVVPGGTARADRQRRLARLSGPVALPQISVRLRW